MYRSRCTGVLVLFCTVTLVQGELFTALVQLERLLHTELALSRDLKLFVQRERDRIDLAEKLANDYEDHSQEGLKDVNRFFQNPINGYLIIKRLTADLKKLRKVLTSTIAEEFNKAWNRKSDFLPDEKDLQGAGMALLRLQDTYALSTQQIVHGEITGVPESIKLSTDDSYHLGKIAYIKQDFHQCVMWMQQALDTLNTGSNESKNKADILDYLSFATFKLGNVRRALNLTNEWLKIEPNHARAIANAKNYDDMLGEEVLKRKLPTTPAPGQSPDEEYSTSKLYADYAKLCRGEDTHVYKYAHKLKCRLRQDHPIFKIRPLREETLYLRPHIRVYHDVISASEIAKVQELSMPLLHRSGLFTLDATKPNIQQIRTSQSAWLEDDIDPIIRRISVKTGALSGLSLQTVELMQVLNYGIGGHYGPHCDFAKDMEKGVFDDVVGNRIATVLCYMTDVKSGGSTVFPHLGVKVQPHRGSCAFWYNLKENGVGDEDTIHAACPVLAGTKWVCNKWFHERGQEFIRPCGLNPEH